MLSTHLENFNASDLVQFSKCLKKTLYWRYFNISNIKIKTFSSTTSKVYFTQTQFIVRIFACLMHVWLPTQTKPSYPTIIFSTSTCTPKEITVPVPPPVRALHHRHPCKESGGTCTRDSHYAPPVISEWPVIDAVNGNSAWWERACGVEVGTHAVPVLLDGVVPGERWIGAV